MQERKIARMHAGKAEIWLSRGSSETRPFAFANVEGDVQYLYADRMRVGNAVCSKARLRRMQGWALVLEIALEACTPWKLQCEKRSI